jgi:outer membrane protein
MNNLHHRIVIPHAIIFLFFVNIIIDGQISSNSKNEQAYDSLSLKNIIEQVIKSHPAVKNAEEALNNADARIGLAKTGYYPEADLTANLSNMGPVTKISIPDMGTFQLFPENNYSASLNYRQLLYDFGRTKKNIEVENENKAINQQTVEQVKQKLSLLSIYNFYALTFIQAALKIKVEQLDALNEQLKYVEKMMSTGSATEYQVLTTKVRISSVESQKVELAAALKTQRSVLNSLLGQDQTTSPVVRTELSVERHIATSDSLLLFAYSNRDEIILNSQKTSLAELRYDLIQLQNKPVVNFMASGGAKNGYLPDLYKIKPNYVVGLGLKVPIFDGMKTRYNLLQAKSSITSLSYEAEYTKRNISSELSEAEANLYAAEKKIGQYTLQLEQAVRAYYLAGVSFKSGSITNLDLLDANTSVSESKLLLLKARIDYTVSVYKLKAALGERLY